MAFIAVFIAAQGGAVLFNNIKALTINVFIAIMQSSISTCGWPHVSPPEGGGKVVSNNVMNIYNIYIYYKNKGFGLGYLMQSGPLQLICIKCN